MWTRDGRRVVHTSEYFGLIQHESYIKIWSIYFTYKEKPQVSLILGTSSRVWLEISCQLANIKSFFVRSEMISSNRNRSKACGPAVKISSLYFFYFYFFHERAASRNLKLEKTGRPGFFFKIIQFQNSYKSDPASFFLKSLRSR